MVIIKSMSNPELTLISVILADDHAVVRAGIRQFLEHSKKIQIIGEASDGEEVLSKLKFLQPDVVVLDIQMPKMNGIAVAEWIKKNHPHIGVLILTAYDDDPYIQAVLDAGANGYVLKTSEPLEIVKAVLDVAEGKAVMDAVLTRRMMNQYAHPKPTMTTEPLTEREIEVLRLAGKGFTNKAIAIHLRISDRTVQNHLAHIFDKLQAASRTEAVMRAVSQGILSSDLAG
ncbi:MAG: response regulator transcription factor [Anaerolineaceae bacterium]|nr:MAG: DNA-binding response regulator [Chloroflexi bacterium HGW-Chloroflexi-8]